MALIRVTDEVGNDHEYEGAWQVLDQNVSNMHQSSPQALQIWRVTGDGQRQTIAIFREWMHVELVEPS